MLLVTLIVIPNLPGVRMEANENSAIASVRAIYKAEIQYAANYPSLGFACSLSQMGGKVGSSPASPALAQVLETNLADGQKSGYTFHIEHCTKAPEHDHDQVTAFEITAVPGSPGHTGHRGFCMSQQGALQADPAGGTMCTRSIE